MTTTTAPTGASRLTPSSTKRCSTGRPGVLLAGTVPFIQAGLAAGMPVLVAVPGDHVDLLRADPAAIAADVRFIDMTRPGGTRAGSSPRSCARSSTPTRRRRSG